jgi:hypothetical protein
MNTTRFYQSVYVNVYRWSFKNFGQGSLPQIKSLFSVSFLMIILLTNLMLVAQLFLRAPWFNVNPVSGIYILLGAAGALLLNYFVLLNNNKFKKLNMAFEKLGKHHQNIWSVMVLVCVVASCSLLLLVSTVR